MPSTCHDSYNTVSNRFRIYALVSLVNLHLEYSLIERHIEHEYTAFATQLGMGITAWSPLGMGLLSGKHRPSRHGRRYRRGASGESGRRLDSTGLPSRCWRIVAELAQVAEAFAKPMAQVALNWVANRPGVGSVIVGATKLAQLEDHLAALDFSLPEALRQRL
ncbi:MAG TPA: aldo/keto reductase [Dyella sp.]|uniref:aldo/keto reductase n=1 Tax=Dyella sp. TaxID=1869338 RepID=UPI002F950278